MAVRRIVGQSLGREQQANSSLDMLMGGIPLLVSSAIPHSLELGLVRQMGWSNSVPFVTVEEP